MTEPTQLAAGFLPNGDYPLAIPAEALEDAGIVLGRRGAGKSNALQGLFEHELDAGHRAVMVDPKGDRWGIRMDPDGSPSRFTVPIFGGDHGDIPVTEDMGEALGKLVAEHDLSCLIDLSQMSLGGKQRFMMGFAPTLLQFNRAALTLFLEEVDQFANQDPRYQPAMLVHHIANFSTLGRQRGIVPWVASQRPAKVNATVRSQADTFVGMKVTSPLDRKAYRDWLEGHGKEAAARVDAEVGSLQAGEALVWIGATGFFEKVKFPLASTFDSGRTPKHGERIEAVSLSPIDLGEIQKALDPGPPAREPACVNGKQVSGEVSAEIEQLNQRIAQLEIEGAKAALLAADRLKSLRATEATLVAHQEAIKKFAASVAAIHVGAGGSEAVEDRPAPTNAEGDGYALQGRKAGPQSTSESGSIRPESAPRDAPPAPATGLTRSAEKMLDALAQHYPRALPLYHVAKVAGVSQASSQWRTNKASFDQSGLAHEMKPDLWTLTHRGVAHYGAEDRPAGPDKLFDYWMRQFPPATANMLRVIREAERPLPRDQIAALAGVSLTSSGLGGGLRELVTHDLIEQRQGEYSIAAVLK